MLKAGDRIGNFEIVRPLAAGGMGVVYLGRHSMLQTKVAIKVLLPNLAMKEAVRTRFAQEAYVQSQLTHPGVVKVTDFIHEGDLMAFVMECIDGPTLHHVIEEERPGPWDANDAVAVLKAPLAAVAYAHRREVVHRDIKPANILLERNDNTGWPGLGKVTDFGLVKVLADETGMTALGTRMGTVPYMSPEQFTSHSEITARADVYAFGMILWRMLSGRLPYPVDDMVTATGVYTGNHPLPPLEGVPANIEAAVLAALATDPAQRPANAGELGAALGINAGMTDAGTFVPAMLAPPSTLEEAPTIIDDQRSVGLPTPAPAGQSQPPASPPQASAPPQAPPGEKLYGLSIPAWGAILCLAFAGAFLMIGDGADILPGRKEAKERERAAAAAAIAEADARKKVKTAWQKLELFKTNHVANSKQTNLVHEANALARSSYKLNKGNEALGLIVLTQMWSHRWNVMSSDEFNIVLWTEDDRVTKSAMASGQPTAHIARAQLLGFGCHLQGNPNLEYGVCADALRAYDTARTKVASAPAWLKFELVWMEAAFWSRFAETSLKRDDIASARSYWQRVTQICEAPIAPMAAAPVNDRVLMKICMRAAGGLRDYDTWFSWTQQMRNDDTRDGGNRKSTLRAVFRTADAECSSDGLRLKRGNGYQNYPRIRTRKNPAHPFCARAGLIAMGCPYEDVDSFRSWARRTPRYAWSQMEQAGSSLQPAGACYLIQ